LYNKYIMKNKEVILIFFLGIIIGVILAPFTNKLPQQAIISPISPTLAETKDLITPLPEGEVLGVYIQNATTELETGKKDDKANLASRFAVLINPPVLEPKEQKIAKVENYPQSNYAGKATIAAVGDSMTDLMGPNLEYIRKELQKYYPKADFSLLNYGVGAENIEKVADRISKDYDYQGRHYQSLVSLNPDLIIVESCAYNPFAEGGDYLNRHWTALSRVVDILKSQTKAKIIILATIAPAKEKFGEGPAGVNWPVDLATSHSQRINEYLDNSIRFAKAAGLPLVDVYHQTLLANGEGNPAYINPGDHIHQNVAGDELIAKLLTQKIFSLDLFN